jgi:hypothetical protein
MSLEKLIETQLTTGIKSYISVSVAAFAMRQMMMTMPPEHYATPH